jgi:hypothetical protein
MSFNQIHPHFFIDDLETRKEVSVQLFILCQLFGAQISYILKAEALHIDALKALLNLLDAFRAMIR